MRKGIAVIIALSAIALAKSPQNDEQYADWPDVMSLGVIAPAYAKNNKSNRGRGRGRRNHFDDVDDDWEKSWKEEEAARRQEELRRQQEEARQRMEEMRQRMQEEAQRRQEEIRRQQEEARRRMEEERQRMQEEARRRQEEIQRQQEEAKRRLEEERQRMQEESAKRREDQARQNEREQAERQRLEAERQRQEAERQRAQSESARNGPHPTPQPEPNPPKVISDTEKNTKNTVEDRNTRDEDESDRNASKRATNKADQQKKENGDKQDDEDDTESVFKNPPRTVEEALKRMMKPATPLVATEPKKTSRHRASRPASTGFGHFEDFGFERMPRPGFLMKNVDDQAIARARARGFHVHEVTRMHGLGVAITRVTPPNGMSVTEAEKILEIEVPNAEFGPNKKYKIYRTATGTPANTPDPDGENVKGPPCRKDHCFGREIMGWQKNLKTCAKSIPIGVVDTAVDTTHPAFSGKNITFRNLSSGKENADAKWHGTGVLSLLAGDQNSGTPGLIPDAHFYVADAFYTDEDGKPTTDTLSMLRSFSWLRENKVKIVNLSLSGPPDRMLEHEIKRMSASGVLFVAAAGNEGPRAPKSYPAAYDDVIAVTAIDKNLRAYRYANHGDYIDVAAPGVSVWTALPHAKGGYHSGTSFAAPFVTAAAAAIYNRLPSKSKEAALTQLPMVDIGTRGKDQIYGRGLLLAPESCESASVSSNSGGTGSAFQQSTVTGGEILPWRSR